MHSHVTMDGTAIEAEEDTVCCGGPCRSCVGTIEAYSVLSDGEGDRDECNIILCNSSAAPDTINAVESRDSGRQILTAGIFLSFRN